MAFSLIQTVTKTAAGSNSITTDSFTTTPGTTLIVIATMGANSNLFGGYTSLSDNKSNVFTRAVTQGTSAGSGNVVDLWFCTNINGGSGHTVNGLYPDVGGMGLIVMEWSGIAGVDKTAGQTDGSSGTTATTGLSGILSQLPALVVASTIGNPGDTGAGSGYSNYTQISVQGHPTAVESKEVSTSVPVAGEFTCDVGNAYAAVLATFYGLDATTTSTSSSTSLSTSSTSSSTSSTSTSLSTSTTVMALDVKPKVFINKWR